MNGNFASTFRSIDRRFMISESHFSFSIGGSNVLNFTSNAGD